MNNVRILAVVLRVFGAIDFLALLAVVMPREWLALGHRLAGLGEWPEAPMAEYLARSTSALYALHGAMLVFISFDVRRYRPLITILALGAVIHGGVMFAIDTAAGMPRWWLTVEGPLFAFTGVVVLALLWRCQMKPWRSSRI